MNVYIGGNITDMQGPCPSGFHIPSKDEWQAVKDIMTDLGFITVADYLTYLLLPKNGYRNSDGNMSDVGSMAIYYSSTDKSTTYSFSFLGYISRGTNIITVGGGAPKSSGQGIRPFKDMPVTPDSGWTALYSDKIYHNSTLGLISLSSDGTNWITMSDKNLGATTVYHRGDTLSEANCGKYYQRGNNYGFPFSGSITTSSSQVDASNYGPGNYYSSSTFITGDSRDSSNNANLRGGVSGLTKELKNAYIGEVWTPGANTLLYLPLKSDLNDYSGNNKNFSVYTGSVSYTDNMVKLNNATIRCSSMALTGTGDFTILCYYKNGGAISLWNDTSRYPKLWLRSLGIEMYNGGWYRATDAGYDGICFLVGVRENNSLYFYRNGTLIASNTSVPSTNISGGPGMFIGGYADTLDNGYYGSVIVENRAWTADEILKFYNDTKSTYGL